MNKKILFDIYRYQLLPLSREFQMILGLDIKSLDELKARKNHIFSDVLTDIPKLVYSRAELVHKKESLEDSIFMLEVAVKRKVTVAPEPFNEQAVSTWPSILILINNDPNIQKIAIQHNSKVFNKTSTIAKIVESNLNNMLGRYNLNIYLEPIFEKNDFWALVEKYKGDIWRVRFDLISPNMSNISKALTLDLASLSEATNTNKTSIELNSAAGASLNITNQNDFINGLVNYASAGGGTVLVKVKGIKKVFTTSDSIEEVAIDEVEIQSDGDNVAKIIKDILK